MKTLKYAAAWLAFIEAHIDTAAARRCANHSVSLPFSLLDAQERRIAVLLVILCATTAASIIARLITL